MTTGNSLRVTCALLTLLVMAASSGCQTANPPAPDSMAGVVQPGAQLSGPQARKPVAMMPAPNTMPRELCKTVLPPYIIEPPDVLVIEAVHLVPKQPYRLRTNDALFIHVEGTLTEAPISQVYPVELGGVVRLGHPYGAVRVAGLTVDQAQEEITKHLKNYLREPVVSVSLAGFAGMQQIAGEHLVAPDGTVTLGSYGSVMVVGMTIAQAKQAIERHLSQFLEDPEISLNVYAYNSKVYYVVTQGAGLGDGVYRFPIKGNETVLDAISEINGLGAVSSTRIWVARPTDVPGQMQILPVKWEEITAQASASTNYQLMPGDRVFIAEDRLVAFDNKLAKITAPLERIMGFSLLGVGTTTRFSGNVLRGGGNPGSNF